MSTQEAAVDIALVLGIFGFMAFLVWCVTRD